MASPISSLDLVRIEIKLASSTNTTYVYSKPGSSFHPRVINSAQRQAKQNSRSGYTIREGLCFPPN